MGSVVVTQKRVQRLILYWKGCGLKLNLILPTLHTYKEQFYFHLINLIYN